MGTTYRVTDWRATVRDRPWGTEIRRLVVDEMFQGRPAPGQPEWVVRVDDDGITPRGYVKASVCTPVDLPAGVTTIQNIAALLPAPEPVAALNAAIAGLASFLANGRTAPRATAVRELFGSFAAELVSRCSDRAEIEELRARIAALEARQPQERAVGE